MEKLILKIFIGLLALFRRSDALTCAIEAQTVCSNWACVDIAATPTSNTCTGTNPKCNTQTTYVDGATEIYAIETMCSDTTSTGYDCSFTSHKDATCNDYCSSNDCNAGIYNVATGSASAINCVQCTSEDSTTGSCYSNPPTATACSNVLHQYCTTLHTVLLDSNGAVAHNIVFRGCSASDFADGCWSDHTQLDGNTATKQSSVSCSKTCSTAGCNNEALPLSSLKGNGLICKSCHAEHSGGCGGVFTDVTCLAGQDYCYSKVIYTDGDYYHSSNDAAAEGYEVNVIYEHRGCASAAVTSTCQTVQSDIAGSNLNVISCEETCTDARCNDHWPHRPTCSQCQGSYWDAMGTSLIASTSKEYITYCKNYPPEPKQCPDPSYNYCYVSEKYIADADNDVKWGYSNVFTRGCLKEAQASKCNDYKWRDEREAHYCQFVCNEDDCNLGSPAVPITLSLAAASVAVFAQWQLL